MTNYLVTVVGIGATLGFYLTHITHRALGLWRQEHRLKGNNV